MAQVESQALQETSCKLAEEGIQSQSGVVCPLEPGLPLKSIAIQRQEPYEGRLHVRFCESLGVKFPLATRLKIFWKGI